MATKSKTAKAGTKSKPTELRKRWSETLAAWSKLLPRRIYAGFSGTWRFQQPETDAERLAAGWKRLPQSWSLNENGERVYGTAWTREPQPLFFAEQALADVAKGIADLAVALRVTGSANIRKFERELRQSQGLPSRNPSLMLDDIEAIVTDVLLAQETEPSVSADRADVPFDFARDVVCCAIAKALWHLHAGMKPGHHKAGLIAKCGASATTFKDRIRKMHAAGLVDQAKERLPWFLTDAGRTLFASPSVLGKAPQ